MNHQNRRIRRRTLFILVGLLLLCLSGIVWQQISIKREISDFPPTGTIIDLGTYQAHYLLKGDGDTAVVFIEGSGTPCAYTDFYALQEELSQSFLTLSFDRAGGGWSSETDITRTIDRLTDELSRLIDSTLGDIPVVLVCHSLGALEAIHYAQVYPENVRGIVFLDSGTPAFYAADSELSAKLLNVLNSCARFTGLIRLLGESGCFLPIYGEHDRYCGLPDTLKPLDKAMYYRFAGNPAVRTYLDCMNENAEVVCEGNRLSSLPILVLSSDSGTKWAEVQKELCTWSECSTQITLARSEHYLHHTNQAEVSEAIRTFLMQNSIS